MSEHDFHPVFEGCTRCAALPGEDVGCVPPERLAASEYTPSAHDVRVKYITTDAGLPHDFDRWLASVKADAYRMGYTRATNDIVDGESLLKVKADAWEEGNFEGTWSERRGDEKAVNPYRGVDDE